MIARTSRGRRRLIYSGAVPEDNPERLCAFELGITEQSYAQCLGELSTHFTTIAVCGTHGKSTTTAMLGLILEAAGYDPTVIVGSRVPFFTHGNLRVGNSRFLVVEACEYRANFLELHPEMIVVTNIEEDHLDYFRDLDHIHETFQTFVNKLSAKGFVVYNADDALASTLCAGHPVSFGVNAGDWRLSDRYVESGCQRAVVSGTDGPIGTLELQVPGAFNLMNALAATTAALELGVTFEICASTLLRFRGIWRRFERVGDLNGAPFFSDYGHHPTAIRATIAAARELYPDRRLVLCFQPHQHARTRDLMEGFIKALGEADVLIVPEIYDVAGRNEAHDVSSREIVEGVHAEHPEKDVRFASDLIVAEEITREIVRAGDVLIVQGAGDVDDLARRLC